MGEVVKLKCDICQQTTDTKSDVLLFGDWHRKFGLTVHYYCLLLSTNLPQNGRDGSGILGFQVRDIRKEIQNAAQRVCVFCSKSHATIACHTCKDYFHLVCGRRCECLFQFCGAFVSYCRDCTQLDVFQRVAVKDHPSGETRCYICKEQMGIYSPIKWIHAKCCGNGYVHRKCMQEYALTAGYYLRCIWCKNATFREHVRELGIFVPDREAQWESQHAYQDLHRGHSRCNAEICNCSRGRDYSSRKWQLILCGLCGSFGVHNPYCLPDKEKSKVPIEKFVCDTCVNVEKSAAVRNKDKSNNDNSGLDVTLFVEKKSVPMQGELPHTDTLSFSSDSSLGSKNTVIQRKLPSDSARNELMSDTISEGRFSRSQSTQWVAEEAVIDLCTPPAPNTNFNRKCKDQTSQTDALTSTACQTDSYIYEPFITPIVIDTKSQVCQTDDESNDNADEMFIDSEAVDETESNQPISSKDQKIVTFDVFRIEDDTLNCLKRCKVRVDITEPRFAGKTIEEIRQTEGLITEDDVVEEYTDLGVFNRINEIIESFNK